MSSAAGIRSSSHLIGVPEAGFRRLLALHFSLILPKHRYAFYDFPAKFTDARAIHNSSVVVLWFLR
jgi:hypothetical protein